MRPHHVIRFSLLIVSLALLVSQAYAGGNWGKVSEAEWALTPPADYPEAKAAVVFDRCSLIVTKDQIEVIRHKRMKVFHKAGAEEIGDISIDYHSDDAIKDLKAQTILPDGKKIEVAGKDIFTKSSGEWRSKTFSFPAADSGCILEFRYRNLNARYTFLRPWYFQSDIYTFRSSFSLQLWPGFTYSSSYSNVPVAYRDPVVETDHAYGDLQTELKTFTWTRTNILPVTDEPYMGAKEDYYSALFYQLVSYQSQYNSVTFVRNWQDLGKEYTDRLKQYVYGAKLDELVEKAVGDATDPREKAKRLYELVAASYVAKADPEGSFYSHESLGDVIKLGYGTTEEKNVLLSEMLKKAGINAWPVLIATRDHRHFNPDVAQLQQFNHIITFAEFADSSFIFMDASTKFCPFGTLPPKSLVDGGFLVDGKNSQLVKVVRSEPKSYRMDVTHITLDSAGAARCSSSCSFSGYLAPAYGQLSEQNSPEEFLKTYFLDKISQQAKLESHQYGTDSTGKFMLTVVYTVPDFARELDNNLILKPVTYRFYENPFAREKRYFAIDFDYPQTYHNIVFVHSARLPASATLPGALNLTAPGLTYRRAVQFADNTVQLDARMTIGQAIFTPQSYSDIKKFFEDVAKGTQDEIALQLGVQQ